MDETTRFYEFCAGCGSPDVRLAREQEALVRKAETWGAEARFNLWRYLRDQAVTLLQRAGEAATFHAWLARRRALESVFHAQPHRIETRPLAEVIGPGAVFVWRDAGLRPDGTLRA